MEVLALSIDRTFIFLSECEIEASVTFSGREAVLFSYSCVLGWTRSLRVEFLLAMVLVPCSMMLLPVMTDLSE
jgi:hypothetical protein